METFRQKVKEKIKLYSNKEYLNGYIQDEFLTDNGMAEIYYHIDQKEDLFDTRTFGKQLELKEEVYHYIENKTAMLGNHVPIRLHFSGYLYDSNDQGIIKHILKEHYAIELYKIQKKYNEHRIKIVLLLLLGVFALLSYALLVLFTHSSFFQAVFTFLFSFSLWEAMDSMIYTFSEIKYERDAIAQNLLMLVEFDEESKL